MAQYDIAMRNAIESKATEEREMLRTPKHEESLSFDNAIKAVTTLALGTVQQSIWLDEPGRVEFADGGKFLHALKAMVSRLYATYEYPEVLEEKVTMDYRGCGLEVYGNGNVIMDSEIDTLGNVVL